MDTEDAEVAVNLLKSQFLSPLGPLGLPHTFPSRQGEGTPAALLVTARALWDSHGLERVPCMTAGKRKLSSQPQVLSQSLSSFQHLQAVPCPVPCPVPLSGARGLCCLLPCAPGLASIRSPCSILLYCAMHR